MHIQKRGISHLCQPNYIGESKYKKYVDKTISLQSKNFLKILSISKSDFVPWRGKPITYKPELDESRSFEANQILKRHNFEFKEKSSSQLSQKYISTLNDLLNLKSQKTYLPITVKMLKDNYKASLLTHSSIHDKTNKNNSNKNLLITRSNNQFKFNERTMTKNRLIKRSMPLLNKCCYANTDINNTKETTNIHPELDKDLKKEMIEINMRDKNEVTKDIFIRPYNEEIEKRERVKELKKEFRFYSIETGNSNIKSKFNKIKKQKYFSCDAKPITITKPYESRFSTQKYFFQVLRMRKNSEESKELYLKANVNANAKANYALYTNQYKKRMDNNESIHNCLLNLNKPYQ